MTLCGRQGVKKNPLYFLLPSYWGLGTARIDDRIDVREGEESTDIDVKEEERLAQARRPSPLTQTAADAAASCGPPQSHPATVPSPSPRLNPAGKGPVPRLAVPPDPAPPDGGPAAA